jgi:hypothetical protein
MTVKTKVLGLLGLVVTLLALAPATLWADSAVTPDFLPVNPNAKGTRVTGTLAIYYQIVASPLRCEQDAGPAVNMFVASRLNVGNTVSAAFALDPAPQVCYLNTNDHVAAISTFVEGTVLPALFPRGFAGWDLKGVTNFRQDSNPSTAFAFWVVADIELAVRQ